MNKIELNTLYLPISNEARVIYLLGLRPAVDSFSGKTQPINNKALLQLLNSESEKFTLGRQINKLFQELIEVGLVSIDDDIDLKRSINGKTVTLPLVNTRYDGYQDLHLNPQPMSFSWQPHQSLFEQLSQLVGIIDIDYTKQDVGDFIAYWMGRPQTSLSLFQWTQKFVFFIKQQRLAKGDISKTRIGSQLVKKVAAIETDSNTQKLVEKYHA